MNMRNHIADTGADRSPFRLTPLARSVQRALLPGLVATLASAPLAAAPTGGQVRAGSAQITHDAGRGVTTIRQNTPRAAIDWQSFNVAKGEQVRFKQPNARATALNRIFDQSPSQIFGQIKANGRVVLMNPNGVFFRPGAEVNVGGLIAGAMHVGVDEFMSGRYQLSAAQGSDGRVLNQGTITTSEGGEVALVGKSVANEGVIVATAGRVNLVGAEQATLDFDGDGLLRFKVDKAVLDNAASLNEQVSNSGEIQADGGQILITASAAADVFNRAINNSGVIKAGRIDKQGGKVRLVGMGPSASVLNTGTIEVPAGTATDNGGRIAIRAHDIENRGTLSADAEGGRGGKIDVEARATTTFDQGSKVSATSARGKGGYVKATAEQLAFNFDAAVDVSGHSGGGEALLGGDLHGANPEITNAQKVFVSSQTTIKADATSKGDGGKVVVWADDRTRFHGTISATGGSKGGNGGMVEVSGKDTLTFLGQVDTTAARGTPGTLLLDPTTLTIIDANSGGTHDGNISNADPDLTGEADAGGNTISWGQIDSLAATTNIILDASGLITINNVTGAAPSPVTTNNTVHLDLTTGSLTIRSSGGNIVFNDQNDIIETKGGSVTFSAAAGTVTAGGVKTNVGGATTGAVTIISGNGGSFGEITTGGATFTANIGAGTATQVAGKLLVGSTALSKTGNGTLILSEANTYVGTTTVSTGVLQVTSNAGLGTAGGGTTVNAGAVLDLNNVTVGNENLTLTGGTLRGTGGSSLDGNIALTANSIIDVPGTELILGGVISGGGFGIDKQGTGLLTLNNSSTYSGTTTITAGSIVAGVDDVFANSILNIAGATARFEMETTNQTVTGLAGSGVVSNDEPGTNNVTFTIDGGNGQTFSGTFFDNTADDISVEKTGTGSQTFSVGATTFAGALTIDNGTLNITTANSLGDATAGTVVSGSGTLNLDNLALSSTESIDISGSGIGNVGALTATGTSSVGATNVLSMGANATIGGAGTLTLNTVLDNNGTRALTKTGTGTLVLAADNSTDFTGAGGTITVNAGVLRVTDAGGLGDTVGGTTVANDAQLEFALGASDTVAENLSIEGNGGGSAALLHSGANTLTLTGTITLTNVGATDDATISVSNAAGVLEVGAITDGAATLSLTKSGAGELLMTAAQIYNGVTRVNAGSLQAGVANVLTSGTGLDIGATGTLNLAGFDQSLAKLDGAVGAVVTNDAGATADVATLTITGGGGSYAGNITENGTDTLSLVKSGSGTQSLSVATGTYDGSTTVTGGTLSIITAASLGSGTGATTANGGTLELNGATLDGSETIRLSGSGAGAGALTASGTVAIDASNSVVLEGDTSVGGTGTLRINAVISESGGARALTKIGTGSLVLSGNNTYTGATDINVGTLAAGAVDVLDNSSGLNLTASGARFNLAGFDQSLTKLDGVAGSVVTNDVGASGDVATLTINGGGGNFAGNLTQNSSDALTLTKAGTGTQILSGTGNTYTGNTIVSGGTLQAGADNVLGVGDLNVSASGASFNLAGFNQSVDELDGVAGAIITNDAGSTADIATLTITGSGTYAGNITENGTDTLSLTIATTGIQTLSVGTGTFDGAINITNGALAITTAASLGTAAAGTVVNGGTLTLSSLNLASSETLSLSGNGSGSGALQGSPGASSIAASNVITLSGDATIASVGVLTISGAIGESGGARNLTKSGSGLLTLAGNNSYSGATTVTDGTLAAGAANVLDNSSGVNLSVAGSTLNLAGFDQSIATLDGVAGAIVTNNAGNVGDSATLTLSAGGGSYAGDITQTATDTLSLTKSGTGTQILAVANGTYEGATNVSGGILSITTESSLGTATGATTANGGTLNLNGVALLGTETVNLSGTGDSNSGALTSTGTASTAASISVNLSGDASIGGSGTLTINSVISESGGARALSKTGTSTLVLGNGGNSYSGATTITQGRIEAGAADVLDNSSSVNLSVSGASLNLAGFDQTIARLDGVAGTTVTNNSTVLTDSATLTIGGGGGSFAGNLTDGTDDVLSLTKSGTGTQILAGAANTYTGVTSVAGGVLRAGVADVLGQSAGLNITGAGASFNLGGFNQSLLKLDGAAGAILTNDVGSTADVATLTITGGGGVYLGDITENGTDTLSITKSTTGTQTLSVGTGTYDGATTVTGGTLLITSAASLGSSSGGIVINNAANAGATFELGTPGGTTIGESITFSGGNNPTLLQSTGGTTTVTGGIVMTSSGTANIAQAGGTLAVTTLGISGAGTLTKTGPGTLQLGVATTLGGLNLSQGVLAIGLANALAASTDLTLAVGTTFNLNGFNQTIASLSGTGTVTNDDSVGASNAAATLTIAAGGGSFSGAITESADDALSLTKSDTGTQVLASTNTYSGLTTVSGGTLTAGAVDILTTSAGLNITASGATFNMGGFNQSITAVSGVTGAIVTNSSAAANADATLTVTGSGGTYAGNITESADDNLSLVKDGGGTQSLSGTNTYTGATTVNAGTLQAGATNILGTTSGLTLNGAGSTFNLAGFDQQLGQLDGAAGTIVTNNAGNTGDVATLSITAGGGTFSGDITETGSDTLSLTKSGSGVQTLSVGTGSYDGATTVSGGTLLITTAASLGSASGQTTASTGTLDLGGLALASSETINLTGTGAGGVGALTGTNSVAASNNILLGGTGAIGTTGTFDIATAIGGSGNLSKVGAGTLVLSGNNTYSGGTTVAAGTLTAGAANVLDSSSGVGVASGATLNLAGFNQAVTKLDGVAGSVVTNDNGGGGDVATLSITGDGGSYAGNITQNGADDLSLTKSSSGTQSLALVTGTYAGATLVTGGTLSISTNASLGTTSSATTANGGTLNLNGLALNSTEALNLSGTGNGGAGALTGTGTASVANTVSLTLIGDASIGGTGTLSINTAIGESVAGRSLSKTGSGTVVLSSAANSYSGATNVGQGVLQAGVDDAIVNSSGLDVTASGASFNLAGFNQSIARLDGVAGGVVTNNSAAVGDSATLTISGGGGSYAGDLTESGGDTLALTKSGTGSQTLTVGSGTYNGATLISAGTLRVVSTASLGTTSGATTANGGTLDVAFTGTSAEDLILNGTGDGGAGALKGSSTGTMSGNVNLASAATINVDNSAGGNIDFTISGNISGGGGNTLTKSGPDTLVLSGNNSYAGTTQIDAGVLKLGAATGIGNASVINIAAGATFDVNDQNAIIGSLGGGSGTLDLGLGSLAASNDIDLTGIAVVVAASGSGNQTLSAGTDGSGSLIIDSLSKSSTGNLTLVSPTLIDINGDIDVNAGNLTISNTFNLAGSLTASGNISLTAAGTLDGSVAQVIDAQGGTLSTVGLTRTAGGAGNVTLGGATAITATGAIDVQSVGDDLVIADNITTNSNLGATGDVVFQGAGTSTFNGAGAQTVSAGGVVRDTAGAVLAKSGGANLILDGGGAVGVNAGNGLGVALTGGSALEVVSGGDVFVTSAVDLTVESLDTGAGADDVDIRATGASAALTLAGPYTDVGTDDFTLVAARDLNITTNALTVSTMTASFGQSGTASDFDIDQIVSATTLGGFSLSGGAAGTDRIDASGLSADLVFTFTALNGGNVGNGLVIDDFSAVESVVGGSGNDTLAGSNSYTVTGADSGTATALSGTWSGIENLAGSGADNTFNLASGGSLSGTIDGLGGNDIVSYASRATAVTIDLDALTAPDIANFASIETFVGGSGSGDVLIGANNASHWQVTGANAGTIDDTTVGAPASVEFNFSGFETLQGGSGADDFTIAAAASVSGSVDGGAGTDTFIFLTRASAVTVNLETGTAADGSSTFASFDAFENFTGSAAANDRLVGRDQQSDWQLTASGAGTIDDTPVGAPDGGAEFTFTGFESLQGGSAADTFTAQTGGALSFTLLAGGAGNDVFNIVASGGAPTTLSANIAGEADNDQLVIGVHEDSPQLSTDPGEFSRLIGSVNLGAGVDTLDYSGSALVLVNAVTDNDSGSGQAGTVRDAAIASPPDLPLISGTYFDVDAVIGNGTQLQGADVETVWVITGSGRGRYGNTFASATTTFENFSIRGGNRRDVFIFKQEGPSNITPQLAIGIDGGDFVAGNVTTHNFLIGSSGADQFAVTGANALSVTVDGSSGAATTVAININNIGDGGLGLTGGFTETGADSVTVQAGRTWAGNVFTNAGADTVTFGAGARVAGSLNLGAGVDVVNLSAYTSAITARVTSASAAGMTASTSSFAGDFTGVETLTLGSGADTVTMTGAPTGTANTINMGSGRDELRSLVDATWVLTSDGAGQLRGVPGAASDQLNFSGVDDLSTTGNGVLSVPAAPASVSGNVTAARLSFAQNNIALGNLGLRVVGDINNGAPLSLSASGNGDISVRGDVTVDGAFASSVATGTATFDNVATGSADQNYSGATVVRGDITARDVRFTSSADLRGRVTGRNMNFDGVTIIGADISGQDLNFNGPLTVQNAVKLNSTSNIFDFNGEVSSDVDVTLSIVPTANTDMFIDLEDGPGHIAADKFSNFRGTLAIGGEFAAAADGDVLNGTILSAPADYLTVSESLLTGGNLVLIGSTVDFSQGNNITVGAGAPGEGTIVVMALGDKVQAGNDGLPGGVDLGNISAPTGANTVTFTGARVMLAATNEVQNSTNMIMDLNGGEVLVAQGARATKTRIDFNVRSRAQASATNVTDTGLIASLTALGAPANLLQNTRASFPNPAAILTILQAVAFVDSSLFETDLSLFGVIGDGIAKSLDQCEDAEGCAPSVTEEQLTALISGLEQRIEAIDKSIASGETSEAKGQTLLSQYRAELASYRDYQTQLHAYLEKQQQEEVGGDEFEDVFEAEETPDAAAPAAAEDAAQDTPADDLPSLEEGSEDLFAPIEDTPAAAPAAPADEQAPADIDEGFETLDESPAPAASPAPAPAAAPAKEEAAPADDFEELEELPDTELLNELMAPSAVNQIAGLVRLDAHGAVIWSGDVILPTLHRRY